MTHPSTASYSRVHLYEFGHAAIPICSHIIAIANFACIVQPWATYTCVHMHSFLDDHFWHYTNKGTTEQGLWFWKHHHITVH